MILDKVAPAPHGIDPNSSAFRPVAVAPFWQILCSWRAHLSPCDVKVTGYVSILPCDNVPLCKGRWTSQSNLVLSRSPWSNPRNSSLWHFYCNRTQRIPQLLNPQQHSCGDPTRVNLFLCTGFPTERRAYCDPTGGLLTADKLAEA